MKIEALLLTKSDYKINREYHISVKLELLKREIRDMKLKQLI